MKHKFLSKSKKGLLQNAAVLFGLFCAVKKCHSERNEVESKNLGRALDRSWLFCFSAMPRSFDSALTRSAQDDKDLRAQHQNKIGRVSATRPFVFLIQS